MQAPITTQHLVTYCRLVDQLKQRAADYRTSVQPLKEQIDRLKPGVIAFLEESDEKYTYEGKQIVLSTSRKKTPISEKLLAAHGSDIFGTRAEAIMAKIEEKREVTESKSIVRRAIKRTKDAADNDTTDGNDDGGDE